MATDLAQELGLGIDFYGDESFIPGATHFLFFDSSGATNARYKLNSTDVPISIDINDLNSRPLRDFQMHIRETDDTRIYNIAAPEQEEEERLPDSTLRRNLSNLPPGHLFACLQLKPHLLRQLYVALLYLSLKCITDVEKKTRDRIIVFGAEDGALVAAMLSTILVRVGIPHTIPQDGCIETIIYTLRVDTENQLGFFKKKLTRFLSLPISGRRGSRTDEITYITNSWKKMKSQFADIDFLGIWESDKVIDLENVGKSYHIDDYSSEDSDWTKNGVKKMLSIFCENVELQYLSGGCREEAREEAPREEIERVPPTDYQSRMRMETSNSEREGSAFLRSNWLFRLLALLGNERRSRSHDYGTRALPSIL